MPVKGGICPYSAPKYPLKPTVSLEGVGARYEASMQTATPNYADSLLPLVRQSSLDLQFRHSLAWPGASERLVAPEATARQGDVGVIGRRFRVGCHRPRLSLKVSIANRYTDNPTSVRFRAIFVRSTSNTRRSRHHRRQPLLTHCGLTRPRREIWLSGRSGHGTSSAYRPGITILVKHQQVTRLVLDIIR